MTSLIVFLRPRLRLDAALLKEQAAGLADAMAAGVKVTFGSRDAVEAAGSLFDRVETL